METNDGPFINKFDQLTFIYRNWRGEIEERVVTSPRIELKSNPYHDGEQFFLIAWDVHRGALRDFAMADILTPLRQTRTVNNPCNFKGVDDE